MPMGHDWDFKINLQFSCLKSVEDLEYFEGFLLLACWNLSKLRPDLTLFASPGPLPAPSSPELESQKRQNLTAKSTHEASLLPKFQA